MKTIFKLLLLITLIFSLNSNAGFFPTGDSITVGGRVITDLANLKILTGFGTGANTFSEFREADGTVYAPSGVAFRIRALSVSSANVVLLLYGDDNNGWNTASVPTTPVQESAGLITEFIYPIGGHPIDFLIPDGKFPHVKLQSALSTTLKIYGFEE